MNRTELHHLLIEKGVRRDAFDVLGSELHPVPGDVYVLRLLRAGRIGEPSRWTTYYSERGQMNDVREFASEIEACVAFLSMVEGDQTAFA